ncbi:MAG TPA: alpha/beta hydrolase [Paraburkholderia sp.]|jgi:pimeloyl-ACP methyl ester carboxylesterase|nr:alpha/beta hydrolase [Paraburkholderia sp.]
MNESRTVHNEGADIAYDIEGQGPLLLLVAGGNGDSKLFARLSSQLSDRYTVVKYDRRANARSTGDRAAEMDVAQAGRDAAAVIRAVDLGVAYVFGNSAGANIALGLTADHPQLVRGLVAHEPPITDMLPQPEAGKWRQFFDRVYDVFVAEGAASAMKLFASSFVGFDTHAPAPGDQAGGTHDRFLAHEFQHINRFVPDLDALRNGGVPIVTLVGRDSGHAFYAQTARELARRLPCDCRDIIGNHLGYAFHAEIFANGLHQVIGGLPDRR